MINPMEPARRAGVRRPVSLCLALACGTVLMGAVADGAHATTHDYCNWDGSNNSTPATTLCFQAGANMLIDNSASLVFAPVSPTIYCGAHLAGAQYAGYSSGNPSCDHPYSGDNDLKADEWVDIAATTHGWIVY